MYYEERISNWLETAGREKKLTADFVRMWKGLMEEEIEEFVEAFISGNEDGMLDAICDLHVVGKNAAFALGALDSSKGTPKFDVYMRAVLDSNDSKYCITAMDAQKSVDRYNMQGINAYYKKVNNHFVIYRKEDNKILKGINYKEPKEFLK